MVERARLLLLCYGDNQYHDHGAIGDFLHGFLSAQGLRTTLERGPEALAPEKLARCDAIVLYAVSATASPAAIGHLLDAVSGARRNDRGRSLGFIGVHGAATSFQDNDEYRRMIGASFVSHPDMGPLYEFTIRDREHPVTAGVEDFKLKDELYLFNIHSPFDVLVSCLHENADRPIAWTRKHGEGKVFYIALGHGIGQMSDPHFQALLVNGIRWSIA